MLNDRIYAVQGPINNPEYPYLTYINIPSPGTEYTFGAESMQTKALQVDVFGPSYSVCQQVLDAVDAVLSGLTGDIGGGIRIVFCSQTNSVDQIEDKLKVYRCFSEYTVQFSAA